MSSAYDLYSRTASAASGAVISAYSTSFGASVKLLGVRHRTHIRNIYALVRVADELVDGVGTQAGLSPQLQQEHLDRLEAEVREGIMLGFSTNPVVHAFALTARECGLDDAVIAPFFTSMRTDIPDEDAATSAPTHNPALTGGLRTFDAAAHAQYVYGSAEVIGLMCMRVFTRGRTYTAAQEAELVAGARALGSAFQNINFLRDLADDAHRLGRDYLCAQNQLTKPEHAAWLCTINDQLAAARKTLPLLPKDARRAVRCATDFFTALTHKLARTPTAELYSRRIRIPNPYKVLLLARATVRTLVERP